MAPPTDPQDLLSDPTVDPSAVRRLLGEAVAGRELARLVLRSPWLARAPRGHGEPVILVPGLGASDVSNAALRGYLRGLGYDAHGWGQGRNRGDVRGKVPEVEALARRLSTAHDAPVHLVGWSLGGVISRGVARRCPNIVAQVITYGSPVLDRGLGLVPVPITAIHSRGDGVVPWRSCIDDFSPQVDNIEVQSAHLGMGIDPDVWRIVTRRLAQATRHPAGV